MRAILLLSCVAAMVTPVVSAGETDTEVLGRFVRLALGCVHREYPNKVATCSPPMRTSRRPGS